MAERWIKLYEKIEFSSIYKDSELLHLWVHLLVKAQKFKNTFPWNDGEMVLFPGQLLTGRKRLTNETGISESKIQRALKRFEKCQMIEQQTTNKYRVITILNWNQYQSSEQQTNNKRTTTEQQLNTYKKEEGRKEKEEKNNTNHQFETFWKSYPKKKSKGQAEKAFEKIKMDNSLFDIIIKAVSDQKRSEDWTKEGGKYIPYPATWLNGKRWEDEIQESGEIDFKYNPADIKKNK